MKQEFNKNVKLLRLIAFTIPLFLGLNSVAQVTYNVVSSHGYTVHVNIEPTTVVAPSSCSFGYNYQVNINYSISFSGTNIPASLWVMQGNLGCEPGLHFFQLPETAGTGTSQTGNGFSYHCHCLQSTPEILGCNTVQLMISGPGIAYQTISKVIEYNSDPAPNQSVWLGSVDTNWSNAQNWQGSSIPNPGSNITVSSSASHPLTVNTNTCVTDITINAGSSALFSDNAINMRVTGDIVNNGEFKPLKGKISLEGSTPQIIGGSSLSTFHNLRINSYSTITLENDIAISGFLSPDLGTFDMNGHLLRIHSDANNTGAIGQIKTACTIIGDSIEYKRFFPAGSGNWRMLSSPLTDVTYEQWNDDIPTTGFPGSDYPTYPNAANPWSNIRLYDGENVSGSMSEAFMSVENITDTMSAGVGHFVYFVPSETTIDMTGTFKRGNHTWTRANASPTLNQNNGWHMLGNPYPCPIDWDKTAGWSKNGISNAVYAFDPSTGQYSSYVNGVSSGKMNGKIESLQAFWVKSSGTGVNLTINESAKATSAGVMLRSTDTNTQSLVRVILKDEQNQPWDDCVVGFNYLASEHFDETMDALKLFANDLNIPNIAIYPDTLTQEAMSISTFPVPVEETIINLLIKPGNRTSFAIENGMIDSFEENLCLKLLDRELDEIHSFNLGEKYEFTKGEMDLTHRFALVVGAPMDVAVISESCPGAENGSITAQGYGEAPWTFTWTDEMGNEVRTTEAATEADKLENLEPGYYTIEVTNADELCNSAVEVIQIEAAEAPDVIATSSPESCNNHEDGIIELVISDSYTYSISIANAESEELFELHNIQSDTVLTHLNAGIYSLIADNGCEGQLITQTLNLRDSDAVFSEPAALSTSANMVNGGVISFLNNSSSNSTHYKWEFGDGNIDTIKVAPQHAYDHWGTYNVKLIAFNEACSDTASMSVQISGVTSGNGSTSMESIADLQEDPETLERSMIVNVTQDQLQIVTDQEIEGQITIKINTVTGQLVMEKVLNSLSLGNNSVDISTLNQGLYTFGIQTDKELLKSGEFAK